MLCLSERMYFFWPVTCDDFVCKCSSWVTGLANIRQNAGVGVAFHRLHNRDSLGVTHKSCLLPRLHHVADTKMRNISFEN